MPQLSLQSLFSSLCPFNALTHFYQDQIGIERSAIWIWETGMGKYSTCSALEALYCCQCRMGHIKSYFIFLNPMLFMIIAHVGSSRYVFVFASKNLCSTVRHHCMIMPVMTSVCLSVWRAPVMIYSGFSLVEIFVTDRRADRNRRCSKSQTKRSLRIKQAAEEKYLGNPIHHHLVSRSTTKTSRK